MRKRFTVRLPSLDGRPGSSWIQTLGFWPLNFMQNRLAHHKIAGGMQRFRAGADVVDPVTAVSDAMAAGAAPAAKPVVSDVDGRRALRVVD
jgi:hypothetical protein